MICPIRHSEEPGMSNDSSFLKIAQASLITGSATIIASLLSLAKSKSIALLQGADGIGLVAQFTSFLGLVAGIAALGLSLGVMKYVSRCLQAGEYAQVRRYWSSAVALTIVSSTAVMVAVLIFAAPLSIVLVGDDSATLYVRIVGLSVPLSALVSLYSGLITGARAIKPLAAISISSAFVSLVIAVPTIYCLEKNGLIIQLALSALAALAINFVVARSILSRWGVSAKVVDSGKREAGLLVKYGMFSLTPVLLIPAVMLITQTLVIRTEGLSANGLFQSAWAPFWMYVGLGTVSISTYVFPTMSATESTVALSEQVNNSLRFLVTATTPISCVIILFPTQILNLLYTPEFSGAATLLQVLAIAAGFRMLCHPIALLFIAKGRLKEYLLLEVSWHVIFLGIVVAMLDRSGIAVIGLATAAASAIYAVTAIIVGKRILGISYSSKNLISFVIAMTVLALTLGASQTTSNLAIPIGTIGVAIWFLMATSKGERKWLVSRALGFGRKLEKE
jgi:PST family polysaccharide transporter/antigen flippase